METFVDNLGRIADVAAERKAKVVPWATELEGRGIEPSSPCYMNGKRTQTSQDLERYTVTSGVQRGTQLSVQRRYKQATCAGGTVLAVDAIAAGTFAIMDITGLRLSNMNI